MACLLINLIALLARAIPILNPTVQPIIAKSAKNKLQDIKSWIARNTPKINWYSSNMKQLLPNTMGFIIFMDLKTKILPEKIDSMDPKTN
jgi:hypothetical protein